MTLILFDNINFGSKRQVYLFFPNIFLGIFYWCCFHHGKGQQIYNTVCLFYFILFIYLFIYLLVVFFRAAPSHMKVPRRGVHLELQLPAYATAVATRDPSRIWVLHHSSRQRQILNPLSEARDRTGNLMIPSQIRFRCATTETPEHCMFIKEKFITC